MVRRCVVQRCNESDISILSHRFPKTHEVATKWQKALNLDKHTIDDLQKKYVVCTKHFSPKSYRNEISNSLNTTAIPNLNENDNNERIFTTDPSMKKQLQSNTPARCHKLPPTTQKHKLDISLITNVSNVKVIRLDADGVNNYLKAKTIEEDEQMIEEIVPSEDVEETFEICEMAEERLDYQEFQDQEEEECIETIVEPEETIQPLADPEPEIVEAMEETQSDPLPASKMTDVSESKDDKLIKLLYPEFHDFTKIQLIELVKEKDRKIEALEDKIKKLELAMRNLL